MMNFESAYDKEAFVWIWLPEETEPVVAGKLMQVGDTLVFGYGRSYLSRENAISLYLPELPLQSGILPLLPGLTMPGSIRDGAPDAWGRRVILNKLYGKQSNKMDTVVVNELTYLLESGSDRIGALDFQRSATVFEPRLTANTTLDELFEASMCVEKGLPLSPSLNAALNHGTSIGGARPKVLIDKNDIKYIAKFSSSSDIFNIVKAEFIAMRLAKLSGLNIAEVEITQCLNKDVLLIKRFDRTPSPLGWKRKAMVSALTLLELDEMLARYASYEDLSEIIRLRFTNASDTLKELFGRITFNILCGNTDDHARNHAAFWDGNMLTLTPAYDICPQSRTGNETSQAMLITNNNRMSQLSVCLGACNYFLLSENEASMIIQKQITTICNQWHSVCDIANLSIFDRNFLFGHQFLNPFTFTNLKSNQSVLYELLQDLVSKM